MNKARVRPSLEGFYILVHEGHCKGGVELAKKIVIDVCKYRKLKVNSIEEHFLSQYWNIIGTREIDSKYNKILIRTSKRYLSNKYFESKGTSLRSKVREVLSDEKNMINKYCSQIKRKMREHDMHCYIIPNIVYNYHSGWDKDGSVWRDLPFFATQKINPISFLTNKKG